ncbi:g5449 [Coccomyxa elongata]
MYRVGATQIYGAAMLGGLLSSSCCVIQLALNMFSVGCAGFSILTPYRPLFMGLTTASLGYSHLKHRNPQQTVLAVSIAMALAGMPELVQLYNEGQLRLLRALPIGVTTAPLSSHDALSLTQKQQSVKLQVDGLRCAACGARLKQALLAQVRGVRRADVEFVSGRVEVQGQAISKDALLGCISGLGYTSRVIEFQEEPPGIGPSEEL